MNQRGDPAPSNPSVTVAPRHQGVWCATLAYAMRNCQALGV